MLSPFEIHARIFHPAGNERADLPGPPPVRDTPPRRREAIFLRLSSATGFFFVLRGFPAGSRFEHTDKQYHRPDLSERYKTRVMRPAMREGIVDQRLARLQGRGSERERTERTTAIIPYNPLSFFHDPTFLPNQPPLPSPPAALLFSPPLSLSLSLSLSLPRHSYLAILETQPRVSPPCLRVPRLCTLIYAFPFVHLCRARARPCVSYVRAGTCISSICIPT